MAEAGEVTRLEHYKRVCSMLDAFTKRMDDVFRLYIQISTAVVGGFIWLKMHPEAGKVSNLFAVARLIIPLLAIAAIAETVNYLWRWYGYRQAEYRLNPNAPQPSVWMIGYGELIRLSLIAVSGAGAYWWLR